MMMVRCRIHLCRFLGKNPEEDCHGEEDGHLTEAELTESMERIARSSELASANNRSINNSPANNPAEDHRIDTESITLPNEVTLATLEEIDAELKWADAASLAVGEAKRQLSTVLINRAYIPRLIDLFHQAEGERLGGGEVLRRIFSIFKTLLAVGNAALYREMLSEAYIVSVAGILECN